MATPILGHSRWLVAVGPGLLEAEAHGRVMLRGTLWLLLLLLLLGPPSPPGTQGHRGATSLEQEAEEQDPWLGVQRLREQLKTIGSLSRRYWATFSCTVWPDHCEDQEAPTPPLGKSGPRRRSIPRSPASLTSVAHLAGAVAASANQEARSPHVWCSPWDSRRSGCLTCLP